MTRKTIFLFISYLILEELKLYNLAQHPPTWPISYKTCVEMRSNTGPIRAGWYVDGFSRKARLDSYGIPEQIQAGLFVNRLGSPGNSFTESVTDISDNNVITDRSDGDGYVCGSRGAPLYVFIYRFDISVQYNIFPSPDPPGFDCKIQNLSDIFPATPVLPNMFFVGYETRNQTTVGHWRASYFLFDVDYFVNNETGIPISLSVNGVDNKFLTFDIGAIPESMFEPPGHVICT